ncbi:MAG: hypothetical protein HFE84_01660 [Lachnospiraceae bacterium]|nr:hypothetical protein [Lachnospiraceae bacterium]
MVQIGLRTCCNGHAKIHCSLHFYGFLLVTGKVSELVQADAMVQIGLVCTLAALTVRKRSGRGHGMI